MSFDTVLHWLTVIVIALNALGECCARNEETEAMTLRLAHASRSYKRRL